MDWRRPPMESFLTSESADTQPSTEFAQGCIIDFYGGASEIAQAAHWR